jgi:hypothetical protein
VSSVRRSEAALLSTSARRPPPPSLGPGKSPLPPLSGAIFLGLWLHWRGRGTPHAHRGPSPARLPDEDPACAPGLDLRAEVGRLPGSARQGRAHGPSPAQGGGLVQRALPEVVTSLKRLEDEHVVLDGELVVLDGELPHRLRRLPAPGSSLRTGPGSSLRLRCLRRPTRHWRFEGEFIATAGLYPQRHPVLDRTPAVPDQEPSEDLEVEGLHQGVDDTSF